jgi:hypothetical protein
MCAGPVKLDGAGNGGRNKLQGWGVKGWALAKLPAQGEIVAVGHGMVSWVNGVVVSGARPVSLGLFNSQGAWRVGMAIEKKKTLLKY